MEPQSKLAELLRRVADGDRAAFAALYRLSAAQLFALALRILRRRDLAEDVLQEAFLNIWSKARAYDPAKGAPLTWMASITRNRAFDRLRSERPKEATTDETVLLALADPKGGPLADALRSAEARELWRCLSLLEAGPRDAVLQVYFQGLTHAELAQRTGVALGTLKSWIRRALMRLKGCLEL